MDLEESFELPSKFNLDGQLTVRLPHVDAEASAGKRAAALVEHLRERLGEGKFDAAYRALTNSTNATTKIRWSPPSCKVMGAGRAAGLVHRPPRVRGWSRARRRRGAVKGGGVRSRANARPRARAPFVRSFVRSR